nr:phospholipase D-like domain-containing protein [Nocardioides lijunqiniae]
MRVAPDRVAVYGIENRAGTPVYVHAKCCLIDDTWATIGSDNFNRRSWTHDSELSAVVVDTDPDDPHRYARSLRVELAREHLDRDDDAMEDCADTDGMFAAFADSAARLDAWYDGGGVGPKPLGRLRRLQPPRLGPVKRALSLAPYLLMHDPDGRPRSLKRVDGF